MTDITTDNVAAIKDATISTPRLGTRDIAAPAHGVIHNITNRKDESNVVFAHPLSCSISDGSRL